MGLWVIYFATVVEMIGKINRLLEMQNIQQSICINYRYAAKFAFDIFLSQVNVESATSSRIAEVKD